MNMLTFHPNSTPTTTYFPNREMMNYLKRHHQLRTARHLRLDAFHAITHDVTAGPLAVKVIELDMQGNMTAMGNSAAQCLFVASRSTVTTNSKTI